jgi:hypothetical protein
LLVADGTTSVSQSPAASGLPALGFGMGDVVLTELIGHEVFFPFEGAP